MTGSQSTTIVPHIQSGLPLIAGSQTPNPTFGAGGVLIQEERKLPRWAGPSTKATRRHAKICKSAEPEQPVKAIELEKRLIPPIIAPLVKRKSKLVANVDKELTDHLVYKAFLKPRDTQLLTQLKMYADQYLAEYDCSGITIADRTALTAAAITIAMQVGESEQKLRQSLKNSNQESERWKSFHLFKEGLVGHKGFFWRKPITIPTPK